MKKTVMARAWEIAREAVANFGGTASEYMSEAMKMAWAESREPKMRGTYEYAGIIYNLDTKQISGNTFPKKEKIKRDYSAKWDANNRVWVSTLSDADWVSMTNWIIASGKVYVAPVKTVNNGKCPRCHSYCYGDCA